jgi:hypothetical protein
MYHLAGLTSSDYSDPTHPNNNGYYKMAKVWYQYLMNNPYDPKFPSYTPVGIYPELIVPKEYILTEENDGNVVTFSFKLPENGIEIK